MRCDPRMSVLVVLTALAVLAVAAPTPAAQAADLPTVDSLLAQTEAKVKDVRDLVADVKMTASVPGVEKPVTVVGTLKQLPAQGMFRLEGNTRKAAEGDPEPVLRSIKIVLKGNLMYQEFAAADKETSSVIKMDFAEIAKIQRDYADVPDFKINAPPNPDFVHFIKDRKARGYTMNVTSVKDGLATVEATPPGDNPREIREIAVIDLKDGLPRTLQAFTNGQQVEIMELSNLRTNTGLKETEFDYVPPPDFKVMDVANFFRGMAEAARKRAEERKQEEADKEKGQP